MGANPLFVGRVAHGVLDLSAKQISPRGIADHGEVRWDAVVVTGDGKPVATYDVLTMVAKTLPPTVPPGGPS